MQCQRNLFHPNVRGKQSKYPKLSQGKEKKKVLGEYFSYSSDVLGYYEILGMQNTQWSSGRHRSFYALTQTSTWVMHVKGKFGPCFLVTWAVEPVF